MTQHLDLQRDVLQSLNPRTGERVPLGIGASTLEQIDQACTRAEAARHMLANLLPAERAALLHAMADELDQARSDIVALAVRETALGAIRLDGELDRTCAQLRLFAQVLDDGHCFEIAIDHARPDASPPTPDLRRMLVSIGPVAVFGSSNFPLAFSAAGGDTSAALAAGCPVIVKAHSAHPQLDADVVSILAATASARGLPSGTVSVVHGRAAGVELVRHPKVRAVGFTGSEAGGRALMDLAAARPDPIPVYAEMGSLNPLIVSRAAAAKDPLALADGIASSVTVGHGQFCTKPGLMFLPVGAEGDALINRLADRLASVPAQPMLSPAIRTSYLEAVRQVQTSPAVRARVTIESTASGTGTTSSAALSEIDAADITGDRAPLIECFGPATLAARYADHEQLIGALANVPASLTISVFADPHEIDLLKRLRDWGSHRVGRMVFGGFPTGVAVTWAQTHGGPYPAASGQFTSVGASSIRRFLRPVSYQDWPDELLPKHLQELNPLRLPRRVDGTMQASTP